MRCYFDRDRHECILTVPATVPPAAVQMFPLGFNDPLDIRQPKMRGAASAPVAENRRIRA